MRALVCEALSDDLSGVGLTAWDAPEPGPGDIAIEVDAAGVNFPDVLMCQGRYQFKPDPPFVPGMEVAGRVCGLGEGAQAAGFALGERVFAGVRMGGFAETAVAPAAAVRRWPRGFNAAEAASFHAAYVTAYVALVRRAQIAPGETLLVHGAAGGVGFAAVDLGRALGARVIACASSEEKRAFLRAYGADEVTAVDGFRATVKELTDGRGADVVFDPVGGAVFEESLRATAFEGRLLVVGFAGGRIGVAPANLPLIKGFSILGVRAGEYARKFPERGRENLDAICALAEQGRLRPHVGTRLPLSEAVGGLRLLMNRAAIGKVVIERDQATA